MPCRPLSSSFRASDMAAITERGEASPLYRLMLIVIVAVAIRKRASFLGRLENRWSPPRQDGSMCKKKKKWYGAPLVATFRPVDGLGLQALSERRGPSDSTAKADSPSSSALGWAGLLKHEPWPGRPERHCVFEECPFLASTVSRARSRPCSLSSSSYRRLCLES